MAAGSGAGIIMGKITYSFYTDDDAEQIAALMLRNKFFMGKYDPELNAERFIRYQTQKGFVFGVVGHADGRVVSYVAAYRLGGQHVCKEKQIILSAIIIDKNYRAAVFSIADMFSIVMKEISARGYREMIAEVSKSNTPSLLMMRKTGFLLFDDQTTVHDEIILHNYMPAIIRSIRTTEVLDNDIIPEVIKPLGRFSLLQKTDIDANGCFPSQWRANNCDFTFTIERETASVVGVLAKNLFEITQNPKRKNDFTYKMLKDGQAEAEVIFMRGEEELAIKKMNCKVNELVKISAPHGCTSVVFQIAKETCPYCFDILPTARKVDTTKKYQNLFSLDQMSGYLTVLDEGTPLLSEMWPCFTYPYLEGILAPNCEKNMQFRNLGKNRFSLCCETNGTKIDRTYDLSTQNTAKIRTVVHAQQELQPLFHFGFLDDRFSYTITLESGEKVEGKFSRNDALFAELTFEDFWHEAHSSELVKEIQIQFSDRICNIQAEQPLRCFLRRNYLRLYLSGEAVADGYNFGTIQIAVS